MVNKKEFYQIPNRSPATGEKHLWQQSAGFEIVRNENHVKSSTRTKYVHIMQVFTRFVLLVLCTTWLPNESLHKVFILQNKC